MRFIWKKHSMYDNCMSAQIKFFKTQNMQLTIQELFDPHYLEIRKWSRGAEDHDFMVLRKWWQIPLNKECRKLFKEDPSQTKVPGNIKVIHKKLKEKLNKE